MLAGFKKNIAKALRIAVIFTVFVHIPAHAQSGPSNINISGALMEASGAFITSASVNFKIEIYDKTGSCLLYNEDHLGINLLPTKGGFSIEIGQGSSIQNWIDGTSPTAMSSKVYENSGAIAGGWAGCLSGTTLADRDQRLIRVKYDLGGGYVTMTPDVPMAAAAYSVVAETLQGKRPADFIQVHNDVTNKVTQANVENVFSSTNYPKLTALLGGTSGDYIPSTPTASVGFNNQRLINVATPTAATDAATKGYADSNLGGKTVDVTGVGPATGNGFTLIWDQATQKWVTGAPTSTDNTKLPLAGGTMSGAITMGGFDILGTGHITMSPLKTITLGNFTTAQETTLVGTLTAANKGASWYNSTTNTFKIWDGAAAVPQSFNGVAAGGDLSGTYPSPTIGNDKITSAKVDSAGIGINRLVISDQTTGANLKFATCATNEVLRYEGVNGWICRDPSAIVTFPVTKVNGKTGDITLNANDLGLGTAALENVGVAAGNVPQLDAGGKLPASTIPALGGNYIVDGGNTRGAAISIGTNDNFALNFRTNGVNAVAITPAGNVGIGTTSAATRLSLGGAPGAIADGLSMGNGDFNLYQPGAGQLTFRFGGVDRWYMLGGGLYTDTGTGPGFFPLNNAVVRARYNEDTGIGRVGADTLSIVTAGANRVVVDATGNVGIGTTSPARLLHVTGPMRITPAALPGTPAAGDLAFDSGSANALKYYDGSAWQTVGTGSGSGDFMKNGSVAMTGDFNAGGHRVLGNSTASANLELESTSNATKGYVLLQKNGGRVGIGTATPNFQLEIAQAGGGVGDQLALTSTQTAASGTGPRMMFQGDTGGVVGMADITSTWNATATGADMIFNTRTSGAIYTEKMRIDSSGRVGIGTSGPTAPLNVSNSGMSVGTEYVTGRFDYSGATHEGIALSYITNGAGNGVQYAQVRSTGSVPLALGTSSGNAQVMLLTNGNVGINTTTPARQLHVNGPMRVTPAALPSSPAAGDLAFDSGAANALKFYDGSAWQTVGTGTGSGDFMKNGSVAMTGDFDAGTHNVKNVGNVGVGTNAPNYQVDIQTSINGTKNLINARNSFPGSSAVTNINLENDSTQSLALSLNSSTYSGGMGPGAGGLVGIVGPLYMQNAGVGSGSNIVFANNGNSERMRIDYNGQVGIGTTAPARLLHVNGPMRITPAALPSSPAAGELAFDSGASNALKFYNGSAWQTIGTGNGDFLKNGSVAMTGDFNAGNNKIINASNIGIGTSSPTTMLTITPGTGTQTPNAGSLLHLSGPDGSGVAATMDAYGNNFYESPYFTMRKAHGTIASPSMPASNDILGDIQFQGWTAANTFTNGGEIYVSAGENWSGSARGSRMDFSVGTMGAASSTNVMRLTSLGVNLFAASNPTASLQVNTTKSMSSWTTTGSGLGIIAGTVTDTTGSGTIATRTANSFGIPTFASSSAVTLTNAANVYIAGAPTQGANTTITNSQALHVASGTSYFGGNVGIGTAAPARLLHVNGPMRITPAALPSSPAAGELAFDSGASNALKFYDGSAWQTVGTGSGGSGDFKADGTVTMTGNLNMGTKSIVMNGSNGLWVDTVNGNVVVGNSYAPTGITQAGGGWNGCCVVAVGAGAANNNTTGYGNTAMGESSLYANSIGINNTGIGTDSLNSVTGDSNTAVGAEALRGAQSTGNTAIGESVGLALTTGQNNTFVGRQVGLSTLATGSNNILIGTSSSVDTPAAATSNFLNIGNVIFATGMTGTVASPAGSVGIGITAPARVLHVNGPMRIEPAALPGTPAAGDLAFDSGASNALKFYNGSAWQTVGTGAGNGDFMKNGTVAMTGDFNAGGNRVLGNSTASANLELESTSHATKGYVLLNKNGGNVGIGTATPGAPLEVKFDGTTATGENLLVLHNEGAAGPGVGSAVKFVGNSNSQMGRVYLGWDGSNTSNSTLTLQNVRSGTLTNVFQANYLGSVSVGGSTQLNVGLDVTAGMYQASSGVGYGTRLQQTIKAGANSDVLTALYINPTFNDNSMTGVTHNGLILTSGNVGIGTTNPVVDANSATFFTVNNATAHGWSEIAAAGNATSVGDYVGMVEFANTSLGTAEKRVGAIVMQTDTATNGGSMQFITANAGTNSERMRITKDGYVGIGATAPAVKLEIGSGADTAPAPIRFSGQTGRRNWQIGNQININDAFEITPSTANGGSTFSTPALLIQGSTGRVGIGSTTPAQALDVVGSIAASTAMYSPAYYYSSDARLKENVQTIQNPLEKVNALRGVDFNWKESGEKDIGFIAQEVEKVVPEMVKDRPDNKLGTVKTVKYGNIVALAIEAIKELWNKLTDLDGRVAKLEQANAEMKAKHEAEMRSMNERLEKLERKINSVK